LLRLGRFSAARDHLLSFLSRPDRGGVRRFPRTQFGQIKIPKTIGVRFSLYETFDVGEDTGTPVLEDYADKMPFRFTGELKRFAVVLQPESPSASEQRRLHEEVAKAMMAVQ
jgi:arylsulfatase